MAREDSVAYKTVMGISCIYGYCFYDITEGAAPLIYGLHVFKEHRRMGHARQIVGEAIRILRDLGYTGAIEVQAEPTDESVSREALVRFYESMGLTVIP